MAKDTLEKENNMLAKFQKFREDFAQKAENDKHFKIVSKFFKQLEELNLEELQQALFYQTLNQAPKENAEIADIPVSELSRFFNTQDKTVCVELVDSTNISNKKSLFYLKLEEVNEIPEGSIELKADKVNLGALASDKTHHINANGKYIKLTKQQSQPNLAEEFLHKTFYKIAPLTLEGLKIEDEKFGFIKSFLLQYQTTDWASEYIFLDIESNPENPNQHTIVKMEYLEIILSHIVTLKEPEKRAFAFKMLLEMHKNMMQNPNLVLDSDWNGSFKRELNATYLLPALTSCAIPLLAEQSDVKKLLEDNNLYTDPFFGILLTKYQTDIAKENNRLAIETYLKSNQLTPEQKNEMVRQLFRFSDEDGSKVPILLKNLETAEIICNYIAANPSTQTIGYFFELFYALTEEQQELKDRLLEQTKTICNYIVYNPDTQTISYFVEFMNRLPAGELKDRLLTQAETICKDIIGKGEQSVTLLPCFFMLVKELHKKDKYLANNLLKDLDKANNINFSRIFASYIIFKEDPGHIVIDKVTAKNQFTYFLISLKALEYRSIKEPLHLDLSFEGEYQANCVKLLCDAIKNNSKINHLSISKTNLSTEELQELFTALKSNTTIDTLTIEDTNIEMESMQVLADALKTNKTITSLNLKNNKITSQEFEILINDLKINKNINKLNIEGNLLNDESLNMLADALKDIGITSLMIGKNKFSNNGMSTLFKSLKTIPIKSLSLNNRTDEHVIMLNRDTLSMLAQVLTVNTSIKTLDLAYNNITEGAELLATAIAKNSSITSLNLSNTSITSEQIEQFTKALETNTKLQEINFPNLTKGNEMAIIKAILSNPSRTEIIKISGLSYHKNLLINTYFQLKQNNQRKNISVDFRYVDDDIVLRVLDIIKTNSTSVHFTLLFTTIEETTAKAIADLIKNNTSITSLILDGKIENKNADIIANALENNTSIRYLDLSTVNNCDPFIKAIKNNSTLTKVYMGSMTVFEEKKNDIARSILSNPKRTEKIELDILSRSQQTIINAFFLFKAKEGTIKLDFNIIELDFGSLGDNIIAKLADLLPYKTDNLKLDFNELGEEGARAIADLIRTDAQITTLSLTGKIGDKEAEIIAEALQKNNIIRDLTIVSKTLGDKGVKALTNAIKQKTITTLQIRGTEIEDEGIEAIASLIEQNKTINSLRLSYKKIREKGLASLNKALQAGTSIKYLVLPYIEVNPQTENSVPIPSPEKHILSKINKTSETLNLVDLGIDDDMATLICNALKVNTSIKNVCLQKNTISDEGATAIAELIRTNTIITYLNIESNNFTSKGFDAILEALLSNEQLRFSGFDYPHTQILNLCSIARKASNRLVFDFETLEENNAIKFIAIAIKNNHNISEIRLDYKAIRDNGAIYLAEALMHHPTVNRLDLTSNLIGDKGAIAIVNLIRTNTNIKSLAIENNKFTNAGKKAIFEASLSNPELKIEDLFLDFDTAENIKLCKKIRECTDNILALELRDFNQDVIETIKSNGTIDTLNISIHQFTETELNCFSDLVKTHENIKTLDLNIYSDGSADNISKAIAEILKDNKTITTIKFPYNNTTMTPERIVEAVLSNPDRTESLKLDCLYPSQRYQRIIDTYFELKRGVYNKNEITLHLTNNIIPHFNRVLHNDATITSLAIYCGTLSKENLAEIISLVQTNPNITKLNLCNSDIGDNAAPLLAQLISTNSNLTSLEISGNKFTNKGNSIIVNAALANPKVNIDICLKQTKDSNNNEMLHISDCEINSDLMQNIAEFLNKTPSIQTLKLSHDELGDDEVKLLAEFIRTNRTITSLDVYSHKLKDEQKDILLEAAFSNPKLQIDSLSYYKQETLKIYRDIQQVKGSLDLEVCSNIQDQYIINAAKNNNAITGIDIKFAPDEMVAIIANILAVHQAIKTVKLGTYHISKEAAKTLATALKDNNIVTDVVFHLTGSDISPFIETFKTNSSITSLTSNLSNTIVAREFQTAVAQAVMSNPNRTESVKIDFLDDKHQKMIDTYFMQKSNNIENPAEDEVINPLAPKASTLEVPPTAKDYTKIANLIINGNTKNFTSRVYANQSVKDELTTLLTKKFAEKTNLHSKLDDLQDEAKQQEFASTVLKAMSELTFQNSAAFRNLGKDKAGWKTALLDLILALCDCIATIRVKPFKDWQQSNIKLVVKDEAKFMNILKGDANEKENIPESNLDKLISILEKQQNQTLNK